MSPLPKDVINFLVTHIETIDQLEILRILNEDRARDWPSADLASAVQTDVDSVRAHAVAMHARGLVAISANGTDVSCRYGVASPELEKGVTRVLQIYKERPVTMIKMVYERAKDPLRDFANAFRVRKAD